MTPGGVDCSHGVALTQVSDDPEHRRIMSIHLKTWQWVVLTLVLLFVLWLSLVVAK